MTTTRVDVDTPDGAVAVTPAQLRALDVLADGGAWQSNDTTLGPPAAVHHSSAVALADAGLVHDLEGVAAVLTAAGRHAVDAGLPAMPSPTHAHGTNACYTLDQCRCGPCREAGTAYRRQLEKDQAYGRPRMVDAEPVREHVLSLMAPRGWAAGRTRGVGWRRIAEVAGVSTGSVWRLIYGDSSRGGRKTEQMTSDFAEALLAVTADDAADGATVKADRTWRRIDAMLDGGFCKVELGRYLTGNPDCQALQLSRSYVTVANARRVEELYDDWKAGRIAPTGPWSRHYDGDPPVEPPTPTCQDCGADALGGGRWCETCLYERDAA